MTTIFVFDSDLFAAFERAWVNQCNRKRILAVDDLPEFVSFEAGTSSKPMKRARRKLYTARIIDEYDKQWSWHDVR